MGDYILMPAVLQSPNPHWSDSRFPILKTVQVDYYSLQQTAHSPYSPVIKISTNSESLPEPT